MDHGFSSAPTPQARRVEARVNALMALHRIRDTRNVFSPRSSDLPVGRFVDRGVQPPLQKYFASPVGQIISTTSRHPTPQEGRIMIVTDAGCGCGGRGSVLRAMGCRAGWRKACERLNGELTNDVAAYGEVVWS